MSNDKQAVASARQDERRDVRTMLPRVDVLEDESGITLLADLPGVPRDRLDLKVEGDTLLIEGQVAQETPENLSPVYVEVHTPRYRRAFTLSRELLQADSMPLPVYEVIETGGAEHDRTFTVACRVETLNLETTGCGSTRRAAEKAAAEMMLEQVAASG